MIALSTGQEVKSYIDWVLRAQSSDALERNDAFDHLVRDFQGMVYSTAYSRLSDPQLAEDAAQDAFLTAYKCIKQLQDVRAFPAWLKRIALSKADRLTRGRVVVTGSLDGVDRLESAEPTPEAQVETQELCGRVRLAVEALPEAQRKVTEDYYFVGESQREISERLNIPLATVKKRLQYARQHLRGLLSGFNETLDRAMTGEAAAQELQPVYIYRRVRRQEEKR